MSTPPCGHFDGSDHLGHLLCHFVHGFGGWLPNNDVEGLGQLDEADHLMDGQAPRRCVVHRLVYFDEVISSSLGNAKN
jgi:hypothetical protein